MDSRFLTAVLNARRPVIMELKRRSADGEELFRGRTSAQIVAAYTDAGAPCLSVVTGRWFGGDRDLLDEVVSCTDLPVLHKDFFTNSSQLVASRDAGASAVLLTATLLPDRAMARLVEKAHDLGLTPFIEVADEAEIAALPDAEGCIVAVNNKDIRKRERGEPDRERSLRLLSQIKATGSRCPVSASGIDSADDAARLLRAGYRGLLVGTGLLQAADLSSWCRTVDELVGVAGGKLS